MVVDGKTFGLFMLLTRKRKGIKQANLASDLGVSPASVTHWENAHQAPRPLMAFDILKCLGTTHGEYERFVKYLNGGDR